MASALAKPLPGGRGATALTPIELAAYHAAVAAVATRIDPLTFDPANGAANLQLAVTDLRAKLEKAIADAIAAGTLLKADVNTVGTVLAQQSAMTALGTAMLTFATQPAVTMGAL